MIKKEIEKILGLPEADISVPEVAGFGDYSTNAALKLAKKQGKSPREIAQELVAKAKEQGSDIFEKIEIAGPGFINFYLSQKFLAQKVSEILKKDEAFSKNDLGRGKKVQVEFISANPTGPLTLGNGRGGFYGDVLANVLQNSGYEVSREYFINDAGHQVEVLGHSILKDEEAQYKGDYIEEFAGKFSGNAKEIGEQAAGQIIEKMIKPTIEGRMKIKFDEWVSEKELHQSGEVKKVLEILKEKGLVYEEEGATWFKSTEFGDDKDRVLVTSGKTEKNGEPTYFLADIAYHYKKFIEQKFERVINIWGADHHGYVARLMAAKQALDLPGELKIIIMQLVRLFFKGQEVRMSKRAGTYITLDELLDEIPLDVARFFFLMRSPDTHMDFDLDLAKEQSEKNPVYYVQYAYARICSILAKAGEVKPENFEKLVHPAELVLIKKLLRLPDIVEDAAKNYQVHHLPQFALDLVRSFHKFYEECRVIDENDKEMTSARLALVLATKIVLKNIFFLMGIEPREKM